MLDSHLKLKHVPKEDREVFKCQYCDFTSVDQNYVIKSHEKTHFQPTFKCNQCDKSYYTKYTLKTHIQDSHEHVASLKCSFCPKLYSSKTTLKNHILVNHTKNSIRDIVCSICSADFITKNQLHRHMKNVHIEGPLKSDICTKTFHKITKKDLHMRRVHLKEKLFKCDICCKAFGYPWGLEKHQKNVHKINNIKS